MISDVKLSDKHKSKELQQEDTVDGDGSRLMERI